MKEKFYPKQYNIYIDESGDEGLKRGSDYFILTAVIVPKSQDLIIAKSIDEIKYNLQMKKSSQLHWKNVKGIPNKKMIIDIITKQNVTIINIIIDTREIKFIPTKEMYYYFTAYLYERICSFMKYKKGIGNLIISARSQLNKIDLISYLMRHNRIYDIDYKVLKLANEEDIKIYPNQQKRLLQMADCCCSSLGQALKDNDEVTCGIYKPLINKSFKFKGQIYNHGFKFVPPNAIPLNAKLLKDIGYKVNYKKTVKSQKV